VNKDGNGQNRQVPKFGGSHKQKDSVHGKKDVPCQSEKGCKEDSNIMQFEEEEKYQKKQPVIFKEDGPHFINEEKAKDNIRMIPEDLQNAWDDSEPKEDFLDIVDSNASDRELLRKLIGSENPQGEKESELVLVTEAVVAESKVPHGVLPQMWQQYQPDKEGSFTCFHTKEKIPVSSLNDDYCDCEDSSDEPGTSACIDARFFCKFQLIGEEAVGMPSNRVNDGICDCCDGSDEWAGVPPPYHQGDKGQHGVFVSPCVDRCQAVKAEHEKEKQVLQEALALKQEYMNLAYNEVRSNKMYGPKGAFYKLSKSCFSAKAEKYDYNICPFKSVTQATSPTLSMSIGKYAKWLISGPKWYILKMENGESRGCPEMKDRETVIRFECGLEDKVLQIGELDRCLYIVHMSTPAAC